MAKSGELDAINLAIGAKIRARRRALGMTLSQLAGVVGVAYQQVQKYESGQNRVSGAMAVKIAETLGVAAGDLLGTMPAAIEAVDTGLFGASEVVDLLQSFASIKSPSVRRAILDYLLKIEDAGGSGQAASADLKPPRPDRHIR